MRPIKLLERQTLERWGLIQHYFTNKTKYDALAKATYDNLHNSCNGAAPLEDELLPELGVQLLGFALFTDYLDSKNHALAMHYPVYATILARYIIQNSWSRICKP